MSDDLMARPTGTPTLEDVARVAGVSRASVSRVVNGKDGVAPHIVEAVQRAVAEIRYVPNTAARSLVTRRAGSLAIVVSGAEPSGAPSPDDVYGDPFFGRLTSAMVRAVAPRDVQPVLMIAETDDERHRVEAFLARGGADGALLVSTDPADPLPRQLLDAGRRVVVFAQPAHGLGVSFVDVAHRAGARLAADHLVGRGCRDVAVISGPLDVPAASERLAGFCDAMTAAGRPYVPVASGNFTLESGETAMRELLERHPTIDGVFAANDLMALGALHALAAAGRRVPDDVAVVGFDDASPARYSRPALTTVRQPLEEMATAMVDLLLGQLDGTAPATASRIFEPTLTVRASA
ncbi:LacI family DNA-binding transcriptional regulator [Luteimicrobium subarcticum]|uniref:LacI family transcriptional regulator n=1 Tax=Luteimicrobium subarcticum TaxID=620910 RepID=A0A2M8WVX4_9MICO|nr:LacI family DNA-binding transcriptional regulator [Luteimicrobium subarcticum]PJI95066.1 LacI family transcriptional regulator [Luteimicrobium subarcticum]